MHVRTKFPSRDLLVCFLCHVKFILGQVTEEQVQLLRSTGSYLSVLKVVANSVRLATRRPVAWHFEPGRSVVIGCKHRLGARCSRVVNGSICYDAIRPTHDDAKIEFSKYSVNKHHILHVVVCPMQFMALDRYKITWVFVCVFVCLCVCLCVRKTFRPR